MVEKIVSEVDWPDKKLPFVVFHLTKYQLESKPKCTMRSNGHMALAIVQILGLDKDNPAKMKYACEECFQQICLSK